MDEDTQPSVKLETNNNDSSEKNDKNEMEVVGDTVETDFVRKKKFFYELGADSTINFKDGQILRVNKTMLSFHSQFFSEKFFGSSPESDVFIDDFDFNAFKMFLDCLFGFEKYSVTNALLIYPIAHKFNVKISLKKCLRALEPPTDAAGMNENVCLSLNLGLFYNCNDISEKIIEFLEKKFGIFNLLENESYCFLLEPASMLKVIEKLTMNSWFVGKIYNWGKNYLKKHNKSGNVRSFFQEHEIWPYFSLTAFESFQSIFEFHEKISQEELYTSNEVLNFLKTKLKASLYKFPSTSSWVKVHKGDVIKEKINFRPSLKSSDAAEMKLKVQRNIIICNNYLHDDKIAVRRNNIFQYQFFYSFEKENCEHQKNGANNLFNESDEANIYTRKKQVFYESSADATFHFKNGDILRVNRAILAFQSKFFTKVYFGSALKNSTDFNVDDFDVETFQTFLDCLIGLKPYTVIDALIIYPIAHKYQVPECLRKCIEVLKPTEMNDNVLLTLNLALFYECDELVGSVVNFLKNEINISKLLEDENSNQLLEPTSMLKLIENVQMDSYLWKKIYEWGENYLKKHCKDVDVRKFFDENKILAKFSLSDFESAQSIIDFHKIVTNKKFLDFDEILTYLENNLVEDNGKLPKKSEWVFVKNGDTIEETITLKHPFTFARAATYTLGVKFELWRNEILCYFHPKYNNEPNYKTVNYNVKYMYKDCEPDDDFYNEDPQESEDNKSEENVISDKSKKLVCSVNLGEPETLLEISSIICTYNFFCDCRILKTSMNENLCINDKNLYFTYNVTCEDLVEEEE